MRTFIDTNIFLYAFDARHREKRSIARDCIHDLIDSDGGVLSYQVLQEFSSAALRKFPETLQPAEVEQYLDEIMWPLCHVYPSPSLFATAFSICGETGWTFYDSLITAAATKAECAVLLTEDLQHGRKIRGVEIRNPFE